jgi:GNAT superfamily N-acetyltransferase
MKASDPHAETIVRLLGPDDRHDLELVDRLTGLINEVYKIAESGLWRDGASRTTPTELAKLIAAEQIAVATRYGSIVGCVHLHDVSDDTSEIGMLVADPGQRGTGVGSALIEFAERRSRDRGRRALRLELLLPRGWRHPSKEFLKSWYGRRGYEVIRTGSMSDAYPHLAPLLATPCDLTVREKRLAPWR